MKKVVVHRPGNFDALKLEEHPDPKPGAGEVRVSTRAVGVNFADCVVRMGLYKSATDYVGWPITPGFEFAGVVSALDSSVTDLKLGDEVFGLTRFGGYATEICVPRHQLFLKPARLSLAECAAFPTVFLTAWYALCEAVRLRKGMHVLVHSAAGGVGGALVQMAANAGCVVVAVVGSAHKVRVAKEFGATHVIDKSSQKLWKEAERIAPDGYHVVLDANGVDTLKGSYDHLRPTGRLIVYGAHSMLDKGSGARNWPKLAWDFLRTPRFNPLDLTNDNRGLIAFNLSYLFSEVELFKQAMESLLSDFETGKLKPPPLTEFPFADVQEAHRALQSGTTVGKMVLVPS
jgi:NADPH:quinone reductase-like Zn-dependent oxidoreductase